ncbi:MAG: MATE family efflux transporter [Eubacteriales bacterium]|nr:MATE family efflux transporter [Eubacteriales bacterium]
MKLHSSERLESEALIRKLFLGLFPVQALSVGLPAINTLLSGFIIGSAYGSVAMAALGFASTLTALACAFGTLFSSGSQLLSGQKLGKGDEDGVRAVFNSSIGMSVSVGVLFTLFGLLLPSLAARLMGASGDTFQMTADYIRGLSFGFPFMILNACVLPFLQLDCQKKRASLSILVLVSVNLIFCLLNATVFQLGLFGIGLATSLSNILSFFVALPHFLRKSRVFRFSFSSISKQVISDILKMGAPAAVSPTLCAVRTRLLNYFLFSLAGTAGVSAFTAAIKVAEAICCTIEAGYTGGTLLISSVLIGERDSESLRTLHGIEVRSAFYFNFIGYALIFLFAKPLSVLFGAAPEEIPIFCMAIRCVNLFVITSLLKCIPINLYHSLGDTRFVIFIHFFNLLFMSLVFCLLAKFTTAKIIFFLLPVGEVLVYFLYIFYFRLRSGRFPKYLFEVVHIPDSFYIPSENRLSAKITNQEEAIKASRDVVSFCTSKGLSPKDAYYYGLCVEEMAMDTIKHGFTGNKDKDIIDLRMIQDQEGKITLMIRDSCSDFNPTEWMELHAKDDPSRSLGIKLVSKISKSMYHTTNLGLNVLFIEI